MLIASHTLEYKEWRHPFKYSMDFYSSILVDEPEFQIQFFCVWAYVCLSHTWPNELNFVLSARIYKKAFGLWWVWSKLNWDLLPKTIETRQTTLPIWPDFSSETSKGLKFKVITDCKREEERNLAVVFKIMQMNDQRVVAVFRRRSFWIKKGAKNIGKF